MATAYLTAAAAAVCYDFAVASKKISLGDTNTGDGFASPFAGLAALRATMPDAPDAPSPPEQPASTPKKAPMFAHKVVVRLERKGHGGKTVTVVEGVLAAARDDVQTTLKKRLGTGARAEGDDVIVQGDVVERTAVLLTELGARVVVGTKR